MLRFALPVLGLLVVTAVGCLSMDSGVSLVPDNPFGTPQPQPAVTRVTAGPAATQVAARVDAVGRQVLAANPQVGLRPVFQTIGAPQPEIFHRGTTDVTITEGLVKQCASDGQLAAVLCVELGKMVAEREALASPQARAPTPEPLEDLRVGDTNGGMLGSPDQTYLAERWKFERNRQRAPAQPAQPAPLPDANELARGLLTKAGYAEADLDAAAPLLQTAAKNVTFEKQLTQPLPTWSRPK